MSSSIYAGRVRLRSCALVIENKEILLVKQHVPTRNKPIWIPPGGEINIGETAKEAAKRETFEETGLIINPTRLAAVHEFVESPFHAVELYFIAEVTGGNLSTGIDPELDEREQQIVRSEFTSIQHLSSMPVYPSFIKEFDRINLLSETGNTLHFVNSESK